jgi:hypothetical protein
VAKRLSEAVLDEFLDEHLPYEVQMLRHTYHLLATGIAVSPAEAQVVVEYALIESFCVHARNLIEFFRHKKPCDFDLRWFAKDGYRVADKDFIGASVQKKLDEQMSHLTKGRTKVEKEKIDRAARKEIYDALEDEIDRLRSSLRPDSASKWKVAARPGRVDVSGPPSATGSVRTTQAQPSTLSIVHVSQDSENDESK